MRCIKQAMDAKVLLVGNLVKQKVECDSIEIVYRRRFFSFVVLICSNFDFPYHSITRTTYLELIQP